LKKKYNIEMKWIHFPLHPDTPQEGRAMTDLFPGRSETEMKARQNQMKGLMEQEGLPYGERTHTYNSRLAQEIGAWADTQEYGDAMHDALYRAYFVDTKNIGDPDVLLQIVEANGLSVDEARKVLEERTFKEVVDENWSKSQQYGVTGVPTFVVAGHGVVGAQPYDTLEKFLESVGAEERTNDD
jgi:predicted DsbA family dithiol-disulfide isomerase